MIITGRAPGEQTCWSELAALVTLKASAEHRSTLAARVNLVFAYWQAGRTGEAIAIEERVATAPGRSRALSTPTRSRPWRHSKHGGTLAHTQMSNSTAQEHSDYVQSSDIAPQPGSPRSHRWRR